MQKTNNRSAELFHAMDQIRRAWRNITPGKILSKAQFGTLLLIARQSGPQHTEPIMLSALAAEMDQSLPAISQRVRTLETLGCLERVPNPLDRRITGVQITAEGLHILDLAKYHLDQILTTALEQLGAENTGTLLTLLAELAEALENANANITGKETTL